MLYIERVDVFIEENMFDYRWNLSTLFLSNEPIIWNITKDR